MKILVLAPHPFFQERGTPIDVNLVLKVLTHRKNTTVDALVYNEGTEVSFPNFKLYRIKNLSILQNIGLGFSAKKVFADVLLFLKARSMIKENKYDFIHAGEETVFFAMFFQKFYKIPYAYDLDSSIAQQMVEKKPYLKMFSSFLNWCETKAIQNSLINFPVCNGLAKLCEESGSKKHVTLHDISQLKNPNLLPNGLLKKELGVDKLFLMYVGNLEVYQGIDLLIESFAIVAKENNTVDLVIIGGVPEDITNYKSKVSQLKVSDRVHFLGPKPFDTIDKYIAEADILVAPRIKGINTPMKVFPYLHSGKPVLLTDLYTHNQLLTNNEAYLAGATPREFADGIIELSENEELRKKLGESGKKFVEENHVFESHSKRLNSAYDWIEEQIF
ncbi:MAG: glycosyltransferase family 4 protein [Ignavibacteriae bacterium]|nr:glycosyltransferase family 4 protein [Ignavibacteriota bacterium]